MTDRLVDQALNLQEQLLAWGRDPHADSYFRAYASSVLQEADAYRTEHNIVNEEKDTEESAAGFFKAIYMVSASATCYVITREILQVLVEAAKSIPPYVLIEEDLPTPQGFVMLEDPTLVSDIKTMNIAVKAFGWASGRVAGSGEHIVTSMAFTDALNPADDYAQNLLENKEFLEATGMKIPQYLPMVSAVWQVGTETGDDFQRFLATFLRFIHEPWLSTTTSHGSRAAQKRAKKLNLEPTIKIVHLRKRKSDNQPSEFPSGITYDHRWFVEGHWRNQWYPSQNRHAPKWINTYVKGPEGKPLIVKDTVFKVDR